MEQFGGPLPTLPILATRLGPGRTAYESSKACDYCRIKKIRCDRKTPCSTCRQRNAVCTTSPRVQRPRRHQEPTSVEYIQRIRILERQLELQSSSGPVRARAKTKEVPHRLVDLRGSMSLEPVDTASPTTALRPSAPASRAGPVLSVADGLPVQTQPSQYRHAGPGPEQADDGAGMLEGPTSLSAHSNRAINVLDQMAGIDDQDKHSMEARELVESLRRIVKAIKAQPSPPSRDTYTNSRLQQRPAMPPIEASVAAIRNAQERRDVTYQFLTTLLPSMPLSDVCLRVYFSEEYSDADFIILNAALIYFSDASPGEEQGGSSSPSAFEHKPLCRENLDAAISRLPLHLPASFPMVLALILAAIHSVEILKPHIAWTLVSSAYQLSHILGCHLKRGSGVNGWCDASNPPGLMFWVIYFLEKTLCLRLERCSMIPDAEVTVMLPGGSPGLEYSRSIIKVAQLAGKLYRMLYGVEAFDTFRTKGRLPVEELSRELDAISAQSQENIKAWRRCTTAAEWLTTIDFLSTSDRVIHHSLQTLIHSALPAHCGPSQSFTEPCIASAREALASHQASPVVRAGVQSVFLSSYLGWFIFARPFVPFTVLFCYVIETGHSGDLQRMRQFADSMQSLVPRGLDAASRHRRLFQVFYDVARRYVELKAAATDVLPGEAGAGIEARDVSNPGGNELSHEIDSCLNALGFSSYLLTDDPTAADPSVPTLPEDTTMLHPDAEEFDLGQGLDPGLAPHLPQWFRVSQQMMGLMDNDHVSF